MIHRKSIKAEKNKRYAREKFVHEKCGYDDERDGSIGGSRKDIDKKISVRSIGFNQLINQSVVLFVKAVGSLGKTPPQPPRSVGKPRQKVSIRSLKEGLCLSGVRKVVSKSDRVSESLVLPDL